MNSSVQASMRDTSYKVQIFLEESDNGNVKDSTCQCPMGEFKCHHVAATLLFGYKKASKTDIKCSWIKHPKSAPPKRTVTLQELYPSNQPNYRCILKSGGMLLFTPAKSVQIITAVFKLHNLCMDIKLPVDDIELNFRPDQGVPQPGANADAAGQTVRQRLIQRFAL
uniref:SWIM-type domain-containing protein n=1 Tax=Magallana gigas TaxID=29159 RepID=A0A8W8MME1_MAGGI